MAAISFGSRAASASWAAMRVSTPWRSIRVLSCASTLCAPHWVTTPRPSQPSPRRSPQSASARTAALSPEGGGEQYGGPTWTRTKTEPVMSRGLCQLSYGPAVGDHSTDHDSRKLLSFLEREG